MFPVSPLSVLVVQVQRLVSDYVYDKVQENTCKQTSVQQVLSQKEVGTVLFTLSFNISSRPNNEDCTELHWFVHADAKSVFFNCRCESERWPV